MVTRSQLLRKLIARRFDPCQIQTWLALRQALRGSRSILDVGCGDGSNVGLLGCDHLTGLDGYAPSVEKARQRHTHDEVHLGDIRRLSQLFPPKSFDACIALDVIEHLTKEEGLRFLADLEAVARHRVVLLTPNGFLPQHHTEQGDLQEHLSGWEPAEMRRLGYDVLGLLGPKKWRGEYHTLVGRPKWFWGSASFFTQALHTRRHPERAAAILCVKHLEPK